MKPSTFFPLVALLAAACTTEAARGPLTESSDIRGGTVCVPLEYPRTESNAVYYRQFDSDASAAAYMTKLVAEGYAATTSGPTARFKEITRDPRLVRLVTEVYEGFRSVFPSETAGLPTAPLVAIIESDQLNAFALGPVKLLDDADGKARSPWIFMINTALLNTMWSDGQLRGLFAHELGHLVLRSFLPEVQRAIRSIYLVPESENGVLGATQLEDAALAEHVEEISQRQKRVGGVPELGLPVSISLGYYPRLVDKMLEAANAPGAPSEACQTATRQRDALLDLQASFIPGAAEGNFIPRLRTPEEEAQLEELSNATAEAFRACVAHLTGPLASATIMQLTAGMNGLSEQSMDPESPEHATLLGLLLDAEKKADAATPNGSLMDRILQAQEPIRSELITLRAAQRFPIDRIRIYDYEEDADDAAVRVLIALGDDPLGNGSFLLDTMPVDAKARCVSEVDAGRPVTYGRFIDTHPTSCWRYYHATQFAKAMMECGPAPSVGKRSPGGTGRASALDRSPLEAVEKGYGRGHR